MTPGENGNGRKRTEAEQEPPRPEPDPLALFYLSMALILEWAELQALLARAAELDRSPFADEAPARRTDISPRGAGIRDTSSTQDDTVRAGFGWMPDSAGFLEQPGRRPA